MDLEKGQEEDEKENYEESQKIRQQKDEQYNLNNRQPQIVIEPAQSDQRNVILCKICLEDNNEPNNLLITPCKCQGSVGNIHQECLKTWIISQGYDLLSPIKCELCNEEYEMEIEISSKFILIKACQDTKCIQFVSFFWLVVFMIGNVAAIIVLLYYQVINETSQWGYIIMAIAILILFEVALVLLVKHQVQEIFFGLYIKSWQILSISQAADQIQNENNNQQINKDKEKIDQTGGQVFNDNISRNQHQIRILESRSVLSNQNQEIYNQNGHKIPSRQSQSRNTNQQEIPKDQNYSLGYVNNEMHFSNSQQQSIQKKSMTIRQMKAHLGLDDENYNKDEEEEEKKENRIEKGNFDKILNENDEKILIFIKNNKDLYNHIIFSYNKMDNQFILKSNEVSKEITVEVPLESHKNIQYTFGNGLNLKQSADQFRDLQNIQQEKILIYENDNKDISIKISQNNNCNLRSQSAFQQQKQITQNMVVSKSHHLIDIFQQENILNQQTDNKNIKKDKSCFNSSRELNAINK
ncbi:hypothetical protein ABPG72_003798 [Tetrahymena utriculariae]